MSSDPVRVRGFKGVLDDYREIGIPDEYLAEVVTAVAGEGLEPHELREAIENDIATAYSDALASTSDAARAGTPSGV